jgi:hypothetical protein
MIWQMKLEFLASGSPDCPLIRLYNFDVVAAARLRNLFHALAIGSQRSISLHEQTEIEAVGGCRLELRLGKSDLGVRQSGPVSFECILTAEGWSGVEELTEPFCQSDDSKEHYQWLNDDGELSLLLSHDGLW